MKICLHAWGQMQMAVNKLLALVGGKGKQPAATFFEGTYQHATPATATVQSPARVVYCALNPGAHCAHLRKIVGRGTKHKWTGVSHQANNAPASEK